MTLTQLLNDKMYSLPPSLVEIQFFILSSKIDKIMLLQLRQPPFLGVTRVMQSWLQANCPGFIQKNNGVTRVGVTRGGNWWCHPIFLQKTDDLFSNRPWRVMTFLVVVFLPPLTTPD